MLTGIFWLIPGGAVLALLTAAYFYRRMMREEEGTERMRLIASHVRRGAMAYLRQQYRVVFIVFVVLTLLFCLLAYGLHVQNPWVPFAFLSGGFFSALAGYFGMKTATNAAARTANAARRSPAQSAASAGVSLPLPACREIFQGFRVESRPRRRSWADMRLTMAHEGIHRRPDQRARAGERPAFAQLVEGVREPLARFVATRLGPGLAGKIEVEAEGDWYTQLMPGANGHSGDNSCH